MNQVIYFLQLDFGGIARGYAIDLTIIADDGILADAATTALVVAGLDQWVGVARARYNRT